MCASDLVEKGEEVLDVETDKISSSVEAPFSGVLRRVLALSDETLPVGALLGIVVEGEATEAEIDAVIEGFQAGFVSSAAEAEASGPRAQKVEVGGRLLRYLDLGEGGTPLVLVHGFGGDASLPHRQNDRCRAGDDVASREDPFFAGSTGLFIHNDSAPFRGLYLRRRVGDERIGAVAYGLDDRIHFNLMLRSCDRDGATAPRCIRLAQLHVHNLDCPDAPVVPGKYLGCIGKKPELHAFFLRVVDFLRPRGEFGFRPAIDEIHVFSAHPKRSAGAIHRDISSAEDGHVV